MAGPTEAAIEAALDEALEIYNEPTGQVLGVLGFLQERFGYIPQTALDAASERLGISRKRLEAVCEFFRDFTTTPLGRHVFIVCDGTACHTTGAPETLQLLEQTLGIRAGQTTEDGKFSLLTTRCVGSCGLAPILMIDGQMRAHVRLSDVVQMVKQVKT